MIDGGWLKNNEIPPGRGSFGIFDKLAQDNKRVIRSILEPTSHGAPSFVEASLVDYDQVTLEKLRGLYKSCLNEDYLNERGAEPLLKITRVLRKLFRGESLDISGNELQRPLSAERQEEEENKDGLTAAVAFLHSRGIQVSFLLQSMVN